MSDGATTSAPARACETASRASSSRVGSFATSPFSITPQCPWSVYSHMHTSVTRSISGRSRRSARSARCTTPSSRQAWLPVESFASGRPKRMTERTPASQARAASSPTLSTDHCRTPGMEAISTDLPSPGMTKSGRTSCSGESLVSRTTPRRRAVVRSRRGRTAGKFPDITTPPRERNSPRAPRRGAHRSGRRSPERAKAPCRDPPRPTRRVQPAAPSPR